MEISVTENVSNFTKFCSSTFVLLSFMCNGRERRIFKYYMENLFKVSVYFLEKNIQITVFLCMF
jgi:hypothetical protein